MCTQQISENPQMGLSPSHHGRTSTHSRKKDPVGEAEQEERREAAWQLEGKVRTGASSHGSEPATPPCGSTRGSARGTAAETHATEVRESRGRPREEGQGYPTLFNDPFFHQENTKDRISGPKMLLAQKSES